jgi:hypothetical protein
METDWIYCALRTESLNIFQASFNLQKVRDMVQAIFRQPLTTVALFAFRAIPWEISG